MRGKFFHFLQSKKASKTKKISVETQLKIANLEYENEELTKKNEKLTNALKLKSQQLLNILLYDFVVLTFWNKYLTKIQFTTSQVYSFLGAFPPRIISILSPNIRRTTQFMAETRIMHHTYAIISESLPGS